MAVVGLDGPLRSGSNRRSHHRPRASETTLRPAIAALPGLVAYYVGVDRDTSTITNTSVWQTTSEAMAMSSLHEMRHLRDTFEQLGVTFEPVANHDMLWET